MVINTINKLLGIITIFMALVLITGCSPVTQNTTIVSTTFTTFWYKGSSGVIQTNDAKRLQDELPFTLVFPEYLPDDIIKNYPPELVLDPSTGPTAASKVSIRYQSFTSTHEINTIEFISTPAGAWGGWSPDEHWAYNYFDFKGTKLLEQKIQDIITKYGEDHQVAVFTYRWDSKNTHFMVDVTGYDQSESRKVVESMIK